MSLINTLIDTYVSHDESQISAQILGTYIDIIHIYMNRFLRSAKLGKQGIPKLLYITDVWQTYFRFISPIQHFRRSFSIGITNFLGTINVFIVVIGS